MFGISKELRKNITGHISKIFIIEFTRNNYIKIFLNICLSNVVPVSITILLKTFQILMKTLSVFINEFPRFSRNKSKCECMK